MNIFFCNVRGIGNSDTRVTLKSLFFTHKPLLMFIAEPIGTYVVCLTTYFPSLCEFYLFACLFVFEGFG